MSIISSHLVYCTPNGLTHDEVGYFEVLSRKAHDWANRRSRDAAAAAAGIEATGSIRPPSPGAVAESVTDGRRPQPVRTTKGSIEDPDIALATLRLVAVRVVTQCSPPERRAPGPSFRPMAAPHQSRSDFFPLPQGRSANFPPLTFVLDDQQTDNKAAPTPTVRSLNFWASISSLSRQSP